MKHFLSAQSARGTELATRRAVLRGTWLRLLVVTALLGGITNVAHALVLVNASSLTNAQSTNSQGVLTSDLDTGEWFASSNAALSFASVTVDTGVGRSLTSTLPADGGTRVATTSVEWFFTIRNNSLSTLSLGAGAFRAEWDFSLSKVESTAPSARFTATSVGTLSAVDAGPSVSYRQIDETGAAAPFVLGSGVRNGLGTFNILAADETRFSATAESGPVDLMAGAEGRIVVTFINSVTAGPGWAGTIDGTRSVRVFATLPAGVTLESPRPLSFVSTVSEPPNFAIASVGLAAIAVLIRLRRR